MEFERLNPQQFARFCDFIYKESGIRIDERKVTLLSNRIRRRLRAGEFKNFDVYYRFLTSPDGIVELESFLDAITTNETYFFRTKKQFDWLKHQLIPELLSEERNGTRLPSLRIWSAGCASGAEPYTIAIYLAEESLRLRDWSLLVLGTDISEEALRAAREGEYKPKALEAATESQRRRYFQQTDDGWLVRENIKHLVEFRKHNLMTPLDESAFDCIFIRNVLIYFDRDSKRIVIDNLIKALAVGGYLVVGPSEGVFDMLTPLQRIAPLLYQKRKSITEDSATGNRRIIND